MPRLLLLALITFLLSGCHVGRFFVYNFANITDHKIFPATEIEAAPQPAPFKQGLEKGEVIDEISLNVPKRGKVSVSEYLEKETHTTAFLVIRNDSILYERYYRGYDKADKSTFFSVSKSITSLLVGIAVDEGLIESIDDPVTKYIPELLDADPGFQKQTIRHLLNMRSGLEYKESYSNPFAPMAKLYYGTDQLGQIKKMKFREEPGTVHRYQSVSTAILGIVVEKVSKMPLGEYLEEKVWHPMGAEFPASMSLDDKRNRSAKAYSGVNATARDLAKIGRLYLNGGKHRGQQLIAEDWVKESITPNFENQEYQYQWYGVAQNLKDEQQQVRYFDTKAEAEEFIPKVKTDFSTVMASQEYPGKYYIRSASDAFYAQGILNQFLYVDPSENIICVRLGEKWDDGFLWLFDPIVKKLSLPTK